MNELGPWNLEGGEEALFALQKLMNGAGFFMDFTSCQESNQETTVIFILHVPLK